MMIMAETYMYMYTKCIVGCRDGIMPKALRGGVRACNNFSQPPPYILVFGGCGRLLHALTPPRSAVLYLQFLA